MTLFQLVKDIGLLLYNALDYSLGSDEERDLSPSLHRLIDLMTSAGKQSSQVLSIPEPSFDVVLD